MARLIPTIVLAIAAVFAAYWQRWTSSNFDYPCTHCGAVFSFTTWQAMLVPHAMGRKLFRCPNCGEMNWATPVRKGNDT